MLRGHAVYGTQMMFDVMDQPPVFRCGLRKLTAVFGLHRKLTDDLLTLLLKDQAVSVSFYHIVPERVTDRCCDKEAAPPMTGSYTGRSRSHIKAQVAAAVA